LGAAVQPAHRDGAQARGGNYKYHPFWNVLLDQLWVR
jgi:hypothetical protein